MCGNIPSCRRYSSERGITAVLLRCRRPFCGMRTGLLSIIHRRVCSKAQRDESNHDGDDQNNVRQEESRANVVINQKMMKVIVSGIPQSVRLGVAMIEDVITFGRSAEHGAGMTGMGGAFPPNFLDFPGMCLNMSSGVWLTSKIFFSARPFLFVCITSTAA